MKNHDTYDEKENKNVSQTIPNDYTYGRNENHGDTKTIKKEDQNRGTFEYKENYDDNRT